MANAEQTTEPTSALDFDDVSPKALWARFKMIITEPMTFFEELDYDAGWKDALVFMGAMCTISGVALPLLTGKPMQTFIQVPMNFVFMFAYAGVLFGLSKLFGGTGDFKGMYRSFAYAMAPMIIAWMPLVQLLGFGYSVFLMKLAVMHSQEMDDRPAWLVVGIGLVGMVIVFVAISAYSMFVLFAAKSGAGAVTGSP